MTVLRSLTQYLRLWTSRTYQVSEAGFTPARRAAMTDLVMSTDLHGGRRTA